MEVLNDILGYQNRKIYQNPDWFCFSLDSIILANFSTIKLTTKKVLDIGTGNAIVPLILSLRTKASIDAVDLQDDLVQLAKKSVSYNHLENQISVFQADVKEFCTNSKKHNYYDLITCNPPYFKDGSMDTQNLEEHKRIARHEVTITLKDIFIIAKKLLKDKGTFAMIHRVERLIEIIELYRTYGLEPKRIQFINETKDAKPNMFFIEGTKNGQVGLEIEPSFILYQENKKTEEYERLISEVLE